VDPDRDVLDRWRGGDQKAGRDLFARYFDPLFRFFANKCGEPDELIQTTFLAIVKSKDQFAGRSSFRTYLFAIARNELYRHVRELKRTDLFDPDLSSIAELVTSAGSKLARNMDHRTLFAALRTLPIEQQTLVELHYWEDLDALALGEIFDTPPPTIRMRLSRARLALREAMAAAGGAPRSEAELDQWARTAGTVANKR
jgi:RNA polymerase sigma-70 factor (ECF subfamily)